MTDPAATCGDPPCLTRRAEGIALRVRLTPGAARDGVDGVADLASPAGAALAVRLRARPVEGAANAALAQFLARHLGVPPSAVALEKGATSRVKTVRIAGEAARLAAAVARLVAGGSG